MRNSVRGAACAGGGCSVCKSLVNGKYMERVGGESLEALGIEETLGHVHGSGVRVQLDAVAVHVGEYETCAPSSVTHCAAWRSLEAT